MNDESIVLEKQGVIRSIETQHNYILFFKNKTLVIAKGGVLFSIIAPATINQTLNRIDEVTYKRTDIKETINIVKEKLEVYLTEINNLKHELYDTL